MRKVLVISYFFPPCSLTAGARPHSWFMHLHDTGYRPIVVTRKWEREIRTFADVNQVSSEGTRTETHAWGEVHYLPYAGNRRDRLLSKYGPERRVWFRKLLSLWELLLENFTTAVIPYRNLYRHAAGLAAADPDIAGVVISGGPFPQFFFGYLLRKKYGLPWIADYRDDWSTDEVNAGRGGLFGLLKKLNRVSEKKWVGTASAFTTISPYYRDKIARLVRIPGYVLQNGFSETATQAVTPSADRTLVYNGTLYPSQPVEKLLAALAGHNGGTGEKLHIHFPGLAVDAVQKSRVETTARTLGVEAFVHVTARIPKNEVMDMQRAADALVMFGHKGLKGIPSSKLYEYLGLGRPVILFEPDADILEEIVGGYNLGFIVDKPLSFDEILHEIRARGAAGTLVPDETYIRSFSRESQVRKLAGLMDRYF